MVELIDRQICFRLPDAGPPASPSGPFRLADTQAEALSDLLQVFACGEESAALAFAHFGVSPIEDAARRGLARVAKEELVHERLLRGLRNALPAPAPDMGLHLASIAALDSAVCVILAALLEPDRPLAREPAVTAILRRIHRDEAGHVRLSCRLAVAFARRDAIGAVAENARLGLVGVLARRGAAFENLGATT